ncbi:MAG: hypothetical protein QF637_11250 [Acidimicrobiales bacterium]|nr:hypothetical protein [Acidimicrobiales bacterium]
MNPLQEIGVQLAQELRDALPQWVETSVRNIYQAWGGDWHEQIAEDARIAGAQCVNDLMPAITASLQVDVEKQNTNPMSILRMAARYPTEVLSRIEIPPVQRDEYAKEAFPHDVYDLTPTAFLDFGQRCHELGITWGATKAHAHFAQRREGQSR